MKQGHGNPGSSRRQAFAWLSFLAFIVASMSFGAIYLFRDLPPRLGFDIDQALSGLEAAGAVLLSMLIMVFLLYLGATLWLLFARLVFSKREVTTVVCYGVTSPLERWLVNKIFPED